MVDWRIAIAILAGTFLSVVLLIIAGKALVWTYDRTIRKMKRNPDLAAFWFGLILGFVLGAWIA